jgi:hypothetical protein
VRSPWLWASMRALKSAETGAAKGLAEQVGFNSRSGRRIFALKAREISRFDRQIWPQRKFPAQGAV